MTQRPSPDNGRRIGPIGTTGRICGGLSLLVLAVADRPYGALLGLQIHDLVLGLVVFPAVMAAVGLIGRRYARRPLRFTGPAGLAANTVVIVVLFVTPYTAGAAALFYGTSLLIAAWRALPGCEGTVVSNLLLHRDDQIGCPTFTPIDALESRRRRTASTST